MPTLIDMQETKEYKWKSRNKLLKGERIENRQQTTAIHLEISYHRYHSSIFA